MSTLLENWSAHNTSLVLSPTHFQVHCYWSFRSNFLSACFRAMLHKGPAQVLLEKHPPLLITLWFMTCSGRRFPIHRGRDLPGCRLTLGALPVQLSYAMTPWVMIRRTWLWSIACSCILLSFGSVCSCPHFLHELTYDIDGAIQCNVRLYTDSCLLFIVIVMESFNYSDMQVVFL